MQRAWCQRLTDASLRMAWLEALDLLICPSASAKRPAIPNLDTIACMPSIRCHGRISFLDIDLRATVTAFPLYHVLGGPVIGGNALITS